MKTVSIKYRALRNGMYYARIMHGNIELYQTARYGCKASAKTVAVTICKKYNWVIE